MSMIRVENLSRSWGAFSLKSVSLAVDVGEYFVILGPCGCGKTLLLESVAGIHDPAAGRIMLNGDDVTRLAPERRGFGFVYQEQCIFPHLTVRQNIAYGLRYQKRSKSNVQKRVEEMVRLLEIATIADRADPTGLSGGESQKVALARALAVEPKVLLLDEPFGALDYTSREQVIDTLKHINRSLGVTVLHVTHEYNEAAALADRIAVMKDGAIVQVGPVQEVFWRPNSRFVAQFLGVKNVLQGRCVASADNTSEVLIGELRFRVPGRQALGDVCLCIRPEDIVLSRDLIEGNNSFACTVREVADVGLSVRATLDADGLPFVATLGRQSLSQLELMPGERVFLRAAPTSLHVFACNEELTTANGH